VRERKIYKKRVLTTGSERSNIGDVRGENEVKTFGKRLEKKFKKLKKRC